MCYKGAPHIDFPQTPIELYSISKLPASRQGESIMKLQLKIKLLDRVRQAIRLKNYSYSTEKASFWTEWNLVSEVRILKSRVWKNEKGTRLGALFHFQGSGAQIRIPSARDERLRTFRL